MDVVGYFLSIGWFDCRWEKELFDFIGFDVELFVDGGGVFRGCYVYIDCDGLYGGDEDFYVNRGILVFYEINDKFIFVVVWCFFLIREF